MKHLQADSAPAPLTFAEEELEMIKRNEVSTYFIFDTLISIQLIMAKLKICTQHLMCN